MKTTVSIPYNLCGFEKLNTQEEARRYNWYYEQRDKLNAEPKVKEFLSLASKREKIRLACITEHGEYTVAFSKAFQTRCQEELPDWPEQKKAYEARFKILEEEFHRKTLDCLEKANAMVSLNKRVATQHGGIIPWTDPLIADRWNAVTLGLEKAVERERMMAADMNRITEPRLITKKDGRKAVRCKIDGIQQPLTDIGTAVVKKMKGKEMSVKEICAAVFKNELSVNQNVGIKENKGVKL